MLCNNVRYYCQNDVVKTYRGAILETECAFVVADLKMLQLPEEEALCEEQNIYRNMNRQNELWWRRRDTERNSISCIHSTVGRGMQETSAIVFRNREGRGRVHHISGLSALRSSIIFFTFSFFRFPTCISFLVPRLLLFFLQSIRPHV